MSHLDDDELADAALDAEDLTPGARQHLRGCDTCADAVGELRRTAVLVSRAATVLPSPAGWEQPAPQVWDRVAAAIADPAVPAPVAAGVTDVDFPRARRPRVWPWAAGMAAAGLALGLLTGRALWSESPPPATTVAQAELDTLDTQQRMGEALVVRTDSGVDLRVATATTLDAADGYLEVWLINSDGKRMVSVGVLDAASGTFPISQTLLDQGYVVVDISREPFDDRPEHSGDSLARGALPSQT
ncbi:anti-sigma factor [Intrasporangium calvum]|uniref:Anti-sigma factor n=1 Tax=Intrasporangium calvum TaxID=53358 RepID=A0ABT5GMU0_9MICO|nr:anti-sigma factor [Intrasporangium calvum]MDC5699386.1 anti-sigma factor [Intrasporangium calvum]